MPAHILRPAVRADGPVLGRLWLAFLEEQSALDPRFAPAPDALERWENDFPFWVDDDERLYLVAERDGVVEGFVSAQPWQPSPLYASELEVYVDELYLVPEARGLGLGRRLFEAAADWGRAGGARRLRFGVLAGNTPARAFFDYLGTRPFSETRTLELEPLEETARRRRPLGFQVG